jgi:hypothetical protein
MLSPENNELLTRVGPGTPMGELLRQYWMPAVLSAELPEPDGAPLRVRLLGEDLVAFRTSSGEPGLLEEVPFDEPWCDIRKEVFSWTTRTFPFSETSGRTLTLTKTPVITVTGKAFYDAIHGGGDTSRNRRPVPPNAKKTTRHVTIWEIHPVMGLKVVSE